jgi:RimJ/RimL family protein N-acetyltransferase
MEELADHVYPFERAGGEEMIEGKKTRLVAISSEYLPLYKRWINDPEVADFLGTVGFPFSMAEERQWVERTLASGDSGAHFTILTKSGKPIGNMALMEISYIHRNAQLGIMIGEKSYWNKGFGTDAIATLLDFAFRTLGLHKVELRLNANNKRALTCYKKCGFKLEGKKREQTFHKGEYCDELIMSVLRSDWERTKAKRKP